MSEIPELKPEEAAMLDAPAERKYVAEVRPSAHDEARRKAGIAKMQELVRAEDERARRDELRIQALGAAISRRDWHAAEQAHAAIRDAFYSQPEPKP